MRRFAVGSALAVLLLALAPAVLSQNREFANPLEQVAPDWQKAAPDWVKPGVRITYWCGAVSLEGTREDIYVLDPQGKFSDYAGRHYRLDTNRGGSFFGRNVGGHGYTQLDVVAVTKEHVFLVIRSYVMDDVNVPPVLTSITGGRADRATGGGLWASPQTLERARSTPGGKVLTGPYRLGESTYDTVVFAQSGTGHVYDRKTGLLLVERLSGQSQKGWVLRNGWFYPAPRRTSGALMLFQTFRQLNLPWADGKIPEAAKETTALHYRGGNTTEMPGSGKMTIPSTLTIRKEAAGENWMEFRHFYVTPPFGPQPEQRSEAPMVWGPAVIGGTWIHPKEIAELETGRMIDRDPITGGVLSVAYKGPSSVDGRPILSITDRAVRYTAEWVYNASTGAMISAKITYPGPLATTTLWFVLVHAE
jgi:hypothetical protein